MKALSARICIVSSSGTLVNNEECNVEVLWLVRLGTELTNSLDAVEFTTFTDNGRTDLTLGGKLGRAVTGLLHGTRYSMPEAQGRCLSSAGQ